MTKHIARAFLLIVLLTTGFDVQSQDKICVDELLKGRYSTRRIQKFSWRPGHKQFSYVKENTLFIEGLDSAKAQRLFSLTDLCNYSGNSFNNFPAYRWMNANDICIHMGNVIITYNVPSDLFTRKIELTIEAENIDISSKLTIAYTVGNNLWLSDSLRSTVQITNEKPDVSSGCHYVYREEWGTTKGTFWSPGGKLLAYYQNDETRIADYPLIDFTGVFTETRTIKYPFTGNENQRVRIGLYNTQTRKTTFLDTGNEDQFLLQPTWSPDDKHLYVSILNREQNCLTLKKYDAETGKELAKLVVDSSSTYVEPLFPIFFPGKGNGDFIYVSNRDGFQHMYLYDADGYLKGKIDNGRHDIREIAGFDATGANVYFTAIDADNPLEKHIYKANVKTFTTKRISSEPGWHSTLVSPDGMLIDSLSSTTHPLDYSVLDNKGKKIKQVYTGANPFAKKNLPTNHFFTTTAADDKTVLHGVILKPADFDSTKHYPMLVYVYGGPHVQMVCNKWLLGSGPLPYFFAAEGYVVLMLDNRGTSGRGKEFETSTFRQLGELEVADQLKGIHHMKKLPYIDTNRIGVLGWSYGGYMTLKMMQAAPSVFKAGIAGAPVSDWKNYELMYTERYMDTPDQNPVGYANSSTIHNMRKIKGKLLLIGGGVDYITLPKNIADILNASIEQNVMVDYFCFPNHDHNIIGPDKGYMVKKMMGFMNEHLRK